MFQNKHTNLLNLAKIKTLGNSSAIVLVMVTNTIYSGKKTFLVNANRI